MAKGCELLFLTNLLQPQNIFSAVTWSVMVVGYIERWKGKHDMHEKTKFTFAPWFEKATRNTPYPFQFRFTNEPNFPELVDIPTGMGKTAMVVLGNVRDRE